MTSWVTELAGGILRTTLCLSLAVVLAQCLLRAARPAAPSLRRALWMAVLLHGILWVHVPVRVPWYEPAQAASTTRPQGDVLPVGSLRQADPQAAGAVAPPPAAVRDPDGVALVLALWLVGMLAVLALYAGGYVRLLRALGAAQRAPAEWESEWRSLLAEQGVARPVPVRVHNRLGPMLIRLPRSDLLVLPASAWLALTVAQRRHVLRHELAHWRRGDVWVALLVRLLALPHWFNPLSWWAVRRVDECSEWACDDEVASDGAAQAPEYARALLLLGVAPGPASIGRAQAARRPLAARIRRLLLPKQGKDDTMIRKCIVRLACLALVAGGLLRVELVAKEPAEAGTPSFKDVAAIKAKAAEFDRRIELLKQELETLKPRFEAFVAKIKEQAAALKAVATAPDALSADVRARADRIRNGDEAAQTAALQGWQTLGNEGLALAARAAEFTPHQTVRQTVLRQALELGEPGYGVIGLCYEKLPVADRTWLVETMTSEPTPDTLLAFLAMAKDADPTLRQTLIRASDSMGQAPLFVAALAHKADPATIDSLIPEVAELKGEDGLLLLYAVAAKGEPQHRVAAAKVAAARGEAGLVILAGAFSSQDPAVRTEVVRAVNAIGGNVAQEIVGLALQDPSEVLRIAAQDAMAPPAAAPAPPAPAAPTPAVQ